MESKTNIPNLLSEILASSSLACHRLQVALASDSVVLNRSQCQCLAKSYRLVLQAMCPLLEHACSSLSPVEKKSLCDKLFQPLHALLLAVQEGGTSMQESLPSGFRASHSWLVQKALMEGMSSDVVDVHLHRFLWTFSVVCEQISQSAPSVRVDRFMSQKLIVELFAIWSCVDSQEDFHEAQSFLSKIQSEEEGDPCQLAHFVLQKLSYMQTITRITHADDLPSFFWVDSEGLQRNPDVLGEGGYGKVYEAGWLGGRFAVKDFFYVENNVVFGREAAIQAQLRHPNVMPLVCCTKNPSLNKCSLVMELMRQDLRMFLIQRRDAGRDPPFSLLVAVDLMLQIARGMEYLHSDSLRIIHRDLKSSNILVSFLSKAGACSSHVNDESPLVQIKVADFGMSKAKYENSLYTTRQTGATVWRAPEVFAANPEDEACLPPIAKYTNKADVYSFALVCYEILTGKLPFEGTQVRKRVLAGERPVLPTYCPPALSSYIRICWHDEPTQRPTFTQICRMLRYFKACMFLQAHQEQSPKHFDWLLHPLSSTMCANIEYMLQSHMQQHFDSNLRSQSVIIIPLEMFCCKRILQKRENTEAIERVLGGTGSSHVGINDNTAGSVMKDHNLSKQHRDDVVRAERRQGFIKGIFRLFKRRSTSRSKENSEYHNAFGLVGAFTYAELCLATCNFSTLIGQGGSGDVYFGTLIDGRRIAVKRANSSWSQVDTEYQELKIAGQLRHRNIVPLLGWCLDQGKLLLVYENMANGDLAGIMFGQGGRVVEWELRYKIVSQVAAALKYLHEDSGYKQIVHRDVKTSNIMLDSDWNARLGDCGLALVLGEGSSNENIAGTFCFIAPEIISSGCVSVAADIFSFGVTVFEIVTRKKAYEHLNISSGSSVRLVEWVWALYEQGELMKVFDVQLEGRFDVVEMERLLLLGLACTNFDPKRRPDINEVLRILSGQSQPLPCKGGRISQSSISMGCSSADSSDVLEER